MSTHAIDTIKIGARHRKDLGDIAALAESICDVGLLHPPVITPDGRLIAGARRIAACKLLGWEKIPVTIIDLDRLVRGEFAENAHRKDLCQARSTRSGARLSRSKGPLRGRDSPGKFPELEKKLGIALALSLESRVAPSTRSKTYVKRLKEIPSGSAS
jgi:ParB family chromosome partitioning protein